MALTVIEHPQMEPQFELDRKLWLTRDQSRVVEDGDPEAASLLGTKGKRIPMALAEKYGIKHGEPVRAPEDEEVYYEDMTVAQLRDILTERDLPVSGTKDEIIARLVEDDEKDPDEADETEGGDE